MLQHLPDIVREVAVDPAVAIIKHLGPHRSLTLDRSLTPEEYNRFKASSLFAAIVGNTMPTRLLVVKNQYARDMCHTITKNLTSKIPSVKTVEKTIYATTYDHIAVRVSEPCPYVAMPGNTHDVATMKYVYVAPYGAEWSLELSIGATASSTNLLNLVQHISADEHCAIPDQFNDRSIRAITTDVISTTALARMAALLSQRDVYKATLARINLLLNAERDKLTIKRLTNAPKTLDRNTYGQIYPPVDWTIMIKTEGLHALLLIENGKASIVTNIVTELYFDRGAANRRSVCIYEGELTGEHADDPAHCMFHIFDVLIHNGRDVYKESTTKRMALIPAALELCMTVLPSRAKHFVHVLPNTDLKTAFESVWKAVYTEPPEGLILQSNSPYYTMTIYKWKPLENQTIDFMARECAGGQPGHHLLWLCCGINRRLFTSLNKELPAGFVGGSAAAAISGGGGGGGYRNARPRAHTAIEYFAVPFMPAADPTAYVYQMPDTVYNAAIAARVQAGQPPTLNGAILELSKPAGDWQYIRVRVDRDVDVKDGGYFGNDYKVAESTYDFIRNPLTFDDLCDYTATKSYFQEDKLDIYKAQTGYNSFVKGILIDQYCRNSKWVIDLAGGRGADMGRFAAANVASVTYVDDDSDALSELINRAHNYKFKTAGQKISITTIVRANLNDAAAAIAAIEAIQVSAKLPQLADSITCNFAIHYFIEHLADFAQIVRRFLKPGGVFICTALNGAAMVNKLISEKIPQGQSWSIGDPIKYQVRRDFQSDTLTPHGQSIAVRLPFSRGELYVEPVCNFDYVESVFRRAGFIPELRGSFIDYNLLGVPQPAIYKELSADDREWISLFSYLVLRRGGDEPIQTQAAPPAADDDEAGINAPITLVAN